jgi:hypothetical protein
VKNRTPMVTAVVTAARIFLWDLFMESASFPF